jgi:hypothetical protein
MKFAAKTSVVCLSFLCLSLASHAQQPPQASTASVKPDTSNSQPVASPNRTTSRNWVTSGKAGKSRHHGEKAEKGAKGDLSAIVWVDSTGRTVGRAIGNYAILTSFDNQLATLTGLYPDSTCDANRVCTNPSGGARWSEFESVYYTSSDCTGTPYSVGSALGTPYLGVPITDSGGTYLYFFKAVDTTRVTLNSRYSTDGCFAIGIRGAFPTDAIPVSDVVPGPTYGTPPFFLK